MHLGQALSVAALCFGAAVSALKNKPGNAVVRYHSAANVLHKRAEPTRYYDGPVITPKVFVVSLVSHTLCLSAFVLLLM